MTLKLTWLVTATPHFSKRPEFNKKQNLIQQNKLQRKYIIQNL